MKYTKMMAEKTRTIFWILCLSIVQYHINHVTQGSAISHKQVRVVRSVTKLLRNRYLDYIIDDYTDD